MSVYLSECKCGGILPEPKIVGGKFASPHSIPFQVGLMSEGEKIPKCGGSLISPNFILTGENLKLSSISTL